MSQPVAAAATKTSPRKGTYGPLAEALYYLVSFIEGYDQQILFLRFLHGFGFACVYPVQQKIVAESTMSKEEEDKKKAAQQQGKGGPSGPSGQSEDAASKKKKESKEASKKFTIFQALNCIGRLLCAVITTLIAKKVLLGYYGWRTSYVVLGYVWILFAIAIVFGMDLKACNKNKASPKHSGEFSKRILDAFGAVFGCRTAGISIFTLFIAEAPMCAFNYMTIYLQYLGVSDTMAGVAIAITLIGGAAGSGAGGVIIEKIAGKFQDFGELSSGMVVMGIRLVVCLLFFLGKAPCGKLLWYHYVELATLGATLVTVGGVDRAIMKDSIDDQHQATGSAIIRTISGISSSIILYQVSAYLTEKVFGYVPSRESFETMATEVKERNAEALRKSMMYIILAGTALNVLCYVAMCFTYKEDRMSKKSDNAQNGEQDAQTQAQEQTGDCSVGGNDS
ncbi:major facilitator superfamily member protein [Babesia ovata]|uniref:Major facilitator superfamily member protein n=1 Tax=Babesia ovata TaxID=189622 RepID=A0A2H6KBR6_9APIC|nr:major facilitator superfamily member protein [Babesia ovata]GBE60438.1 major facilitator superfamily member protein [Babesia ovata]